MPGPTSQDVYDVLKSIDARLATIVAHFGAGMQGQSRVPAGAGDHPVPSLASDRDLDSQYGNPEVKAKDPRDWTGEAMKGRRFSECPPEYLDLVASRLDYFADTNRETAEDQQTPPENVQELLKKAKYNRIDASRARGWAARVRAGWKAPEPSAFGAPATGDIDDSAIPF